MLQEPKERAFPDRPELLEPQAPLETRELTAKTDSPVKMGLKVQQDSQEPMDNRAPTVSLDSPEKTELQVLMLPTVRAHPEPPRLSPKSQSPKMDTQNKRHLKPAAFGLIHSILLHPINFVNIFVVLEELEQ